MGAWGMGVFDDDTSCDLLYDAMDTDAGTFIAKAVGHKDSDYLEYDDCHEVIVSGAILDSLLVGTKYSHETEGYDDWLSKQDKSALSKYKEDIVSGLNLVLSDKSELNELWQENEEDYPTWKSNIEGIIANLRS
ncbi:DUF4259 domain-containing protein [Saccharophagus degradans]|uniref:DUF4259 domain-containing protein n=1 Tax=Saccharophagus degradans (strain 2-40 / ATCC 43961 / DSM 17024) TaxID=203122 RepID=Q21JN3_SACD2|nr:DUF4259 domain-containing protein [Saccharophagus degradans]ABD81096.1 hypothetical protein Sde_1836 [Saccharophagus degradans 2-40]